MGKNSEKVSLTKEELIRLRDLQGFTWGYDTKAYLKLSYAIEKIEDRESASE